MADSAMVTELATERGGRKWASLSRRIFIALASVSVTVCLLASFASVFVYQRSVMEDALAGLERECQAVSSAVSIGAETGQDEVKLLQGLNFGDVRATLVASDGRVLYDSFTAASSLSSHLSRPEISDALQTGTGASVRDSETAGYVSLYYAVRLDSGNVLRLSEDRDDIMRVIANDLGVMTGMVLAVVVTSWIVSRALAWRLVQPILAIDTSSGDAESPYEELSPLVTRLNEQQAELRIRMERILDANAMRQEFTANVTHELKTPIASISGASELLRDGLVQPEDTTEFAARIYDDAQRLSSLVTDILTLSKLDESERVGDQAIFGEPQVVDLYVLAKDEVEHLSDRARRHGVTVRLQGTSTFVSGYPRILGEMIQNLCDNAIRYNHEGGSVHVFVLPVDGKATVRVSDTGMGIATESQEKVFERFYRVDKSRSRASGGTGLGLAIVKHAAMLHGATVDLKSEPGSGTDITVAFP